MRILALTICVALGVGVIAGGSFHFLHGAQPESATRAIGIQAGTPTPEKGSTPGPSVENLLKDVDGSDSARLHALEALGDLGKRAEKAAIPLMEGVQFSNRPKSPVLIALGRIGTPEKEITRYLTEIYTKSEAGSQDRNAALLGITLMGQKASDAGTQVQRDFLAAYKRYDSITNLPSNRPENIAILRDSYELAIALVSIFPTSKSAGDAFTRIIAGDPLWPEKEEVQAAIGFDHVEDESIRLHVLALRIALRSALPLREISGEFSSRLVAHSPRFILAPPQVVPQTQYGTTSSKEAGNSLPIPPQQTRGVKQVWGVDDPSGTGTGIYSTHGPVMPQKVVTYDPPINSDASYKKFWEENIRIPNLQDKASKEQLALNEFREIQAARSTATCYIILKELNSSLRQNPNADDRGIDSAIKQLPANFRDRNLLILEAIGLIGTTTDDSSRVLTSYVLSGESAERARAAQALGRLTPNKTDVREALQRSADHDPNPVVRETSQWALGRFGQQKP